MVQQLQIPQIGQIEASRHLFQAVPTGSQNMKDLVVLCVITISSIQVTANLLQLKQNVELIALFITSNTTGTIRALPTQAPLPQEVALVQMRCLWLSRQLPMTVLSILLPWNL